MKAIMAIKKWVPRRLTQEERQARATAKAKREAELAAEDLAWDELRTSRAIAALPKPDRT